QALLAPDEHTLWIGTRYGLNRFDRRTNTFKRYFRKDGLPSNNIAGLALDGQGSLWVTTNQGICRFDLASETCTNYTKADGLQGSEFNRMAYLVTRDGAIFFGGVNGFNVIYPERLRKNTF